MKTRSALVYFPGYPFELQALSPSRELASIAGSLLEQGHETRVMDFGTVETVQRLVAGKPSDSLARIADNLLSDGSLNPLQTLHALWHARAANRAFGEKREQFGREIAKRLALSRGLHFAAFMVNTVEDVASTLGIVKALRTEKPRLRLIAFGAMASQLGDVLAGVPSAFDCICTSEAESTIVALAERIDARQTWKSIPNLTMAADGGGGRPQEAGASLSTMPVPAYEPDAYPALRAEQKIRLFEIEECRPGTMDFGRSFGSPIRIRSVGAVCNEMWRIGTLFGARAFHMSSSAAPASHVSAVAHEILRRGMSVVYTRAWDVTQAVPATFPVLYSSGCTALSFPIYSGSQRLLDRYYARPMTVTEIERTLRCSKGIGIYTIAQFTYPCSEDDVHTRAETLRIIERTRPDAAPITLPESMMDAHGQLDGDRLCRQLATTARKYPEWPGTWRAAPTSSTYLSSQEIVALRRSLVGEIEQRGILSDRSEPLIRLARIMADSGCERAIGERIHRDFLRGDAMGLAALVDSFNEVACVPAKRMALRAPESERLAVGN